MLIDDYRIELTEPDCLPEARGTIYSARVLFADDVSEVMPYLNAVLERADYGGDNDYIIWKDSERRYALRPRELAVSSVADRSEAAAVSAATIAMINEVWEKKDEIGPDFKRKERPKALDLFRLLPRTNCHECDLPSCMAFAVELAEGKRAPSDCPVLIAPGSEELLSELQRLCG